MTIRALLPALGLLWGLAVAPAPADEPSSEPILRLEAGVHTAVVNTGAITRDGRLLTVSDDKTARLWTPDGAASEVLRVPVGPGSEGALYAVAASPTKDYGVVGGSTGIAWDRAGAVYAFDLRSGRMTGRVAGLPGTVHALAYSHDGRYLAIGTGGGRALLRVVDLVERALAAEDLSYADTLVSIEFLADGRLLTAALDGKVRLYDAHFELTAVRSLPERERPWRLAPSPAGDRVAVGSLDAAHVHVFSIDGLEPLARLKGVDGRRGSLSAVAWMGSTLLASGTYGDASGGKRIRAWEMTDGSADGMTRESVIATDTVTDLIALPDGHIAYTTAEPSVGVLDPATLIARSPEPLVADFRDAFEGTFALASDGSAVDFGVVQGGRSPLRFDLNELMLTRSPRSRPDMAAPSAPRSVKGWRNGSAPTIAGVPIALDENELARAVAAAPDEQRVLLGADYSLRLLRAGVPLWQRRLHAPAWAVALSGDGRVALAALGDGTLRWFRASDGAELLALFVTRDGRWIVWTPEGFFDHAPGADGLVGYHLNQGRAANPKFVRSGQLHRTFYRPDLVAMKAKGLDISSHVAQGGDAKTVVSARVPPELRLLAWCVHEECNELAADTRGGDPSIEVAIPEVTLRIGVDDRGGGIGDLVLKRNAASVATRTVDLASADAMRVQEHTVTLEPGENLITIFAFDAEQRVETGEPVRITIRYTTAQPNAPVLHVLSVGINRYRSEAVPELVNAVSDAEGIAELMRRGIGGLFREARLTVLVEGQATLEAIERAFRDIAASARPEDVVLVFLAGHGVAMDGQYHFLPYDVGGLTSEVIQATALDQATLTGLLSSLPTSRAAVLLDTCYAGAFAVPDSVLRPSQERTWAMTLASSTGRFILAGTTNQQEALDGIDGHGVFTAVVLDGLNGEADGVWDEGKGNEDGRVDVVELNRYAKTRVPVEAKKLAPTHAQRAVGFFQGSEFFELRAVAP